MVMENIASLQDIFQFKLGEECLRKLETQGEKLNRQYKKKNTPRKRAPNIG